MSLVIFLIVCRASSRCFPTPKRTTSLWLHSWLHDSSWGTKRDNCISNYKLNALILGHIWISERKPSSQKLLWEQARTHPEKQDCSLHSHSRERQQPHDKGSNRGTVGSRSCTWGIGKCVAYWMWRGWSYRDASIPSTDLSFSRVFASFSGSGFSGEGLALDSQCIGGENIWGDIRTRKGS